MAGRRTRSSKVRLVDSLPVVQSTASTECVEAAPWEAIEAVEAVDVVEPQQVPAVPGSQGKCLIITLITLPTVPRPLFPADYSIFARKENRRTMFCLFVDRVLKEIDDVSVERVEISYITSL